jgi:uncharacterized phage protein (TIGR01671 family)
MRDINFKAKTKDGKRWVEGYYFTKPILDKHFIICDESQWEIDKDTLCQYTGLTDKNGNKIWENDVVKRYNSNGDEWKLSKIVWADYSLNIGWCIEDIKSLTEYSNKLFKVGFDVNDTEKCEVIGNIFDNSELVNRNDF